MPDGSGFAQSDYGKSSLVSQILIALGLADFRSNATDCARFSIRR